MQVFVRLCNGKHMLKGSHLKKEECYFTDFWDTTRRIYFYFCVTHLMKAMRGQLEKSSRERAGPF